MTTTRTSLVGLALLSALTGAAVGVSVDHTLDTPAAATTHHVSNPCYQRGAYSQILVDDLAVVQQAVTVNQAAPTHKTAQAVDTAVHVLNADTAARDRYALACRVQIATTGSNR